MLAAVLCNWLYWHVLNDRRGLEKTVVVWALAIITSRGGP